MSRLYEKGQKTTFWKHNKRKNHYLCSNQYGSNDSNNCIDNRIVLNLALKTSERSALVAKAEGTSDVIDDWLIGQADMVETIKNALEGMEKDNPEAVSKNGLICGNVRASCGKF